MDNRACFHSKKISNLHFAREKLSPDGAGYGEKDTGAGKLLKTIAAHRE
jgi:hypothetical protein